MASGIGSVNGFQPTESWINKLENRNYFLVFQKIDAERKACQLSAKPWDPLIIIIQINDCLCHSQPSTSNLMSFHFARLARFLSAMRIAVAGIFVFCANGSCDLWLSFRKFLALAWNPVTIDLELAHCNGQFRQFGTSFTIQLNHKYWHHELPKNFLKWNWNVLRCYCK